LLIRERTWDEEERTWIGRERKRGAIEDLVGLLRGQEAGGFRVREGDSTFLSGVTFVLTLDADTVLPRDAARKLIATIAHPLNRARIDEERRVVDSGYGLIQPRVAMSLPASTLTRFARLFSGETGVDPYGSISSDIYQDAFGEGSFTGKGIFEVAVYGAVLEGRFPPDTLLSHDLLEGSYLRSGLASDIEVFDEYPATYPAQAARMHRWVRGDWQIAPWLLSRVPTAGRSERNPLGTLAVWKIGDNLRRSLLPPSLLLMFAMGLAIVPDGDVLWPIALFGVALFPVLLHLADSVLNHPPGVTLRSTLRTLRADLVNDTVRGLFTLMVLPHAAWTNLDAAARALWRSGV
jgi:hypothetical protein